MSEPVLMHDAAVSAFDNASGVVSTDDSEVSFNWDDEHIVRVDAPADLEGAFDTDRFYKIEDATIARPIKQTYMVDGELRQYKKPAAELRKAAWSFDNSPFTLDHPDTGMVKDVDDVHGFWRGARYDNDSERLLEDLYVPVTDDEALEWLEDHSDVSIGFFNRLTDDYDADTGSLSDDDVDGFQVDIFGNHVAGVEHGRCSGEDGCGLDNRNHGTVVTAADSASAPSQSVSADAEGLDRSIPESAQQAAQDFLNAVDAGKVPEDCGGPDGLGRRRAEMFADGGELSLEVWVTGGTSAVANWHPRHEGNEEYDESDVDTPWEDCGYAMFKAWGGETARNKAERLKQQYESQDAQDAYPVGATVTWQSGDARGEIVDRTDDGCFSDRIDGDQEICAGDSIVYLIEEDDGATVAHKHGTLSMTTDSMHDAPRGIYVADDGTWLAVAPDEHSDDSTSHPDDGKYPVESCSDVSDAWQLRGHGDVDIEQSTLGNRIQRAARALDCDVPGESEGASDSMDSAATEDCGCTSNMTNDTENDDGFDIPDLSVDALAEKNSDVDELREERDSLEAQLDEMRGEIVDAFDAAEHVSIELAEDECPCEAVADVVSDFDSAVAEMEDLRNELSEYREDEIAEKLDELESLGADRDEWRETADGADSPLAALDEEIERRREVLDAAPDTSVKDIDTDASDDDAAKTDMYGKRTYGRGYGA